MVPCQYVTGGNFFRFGWDFSCLKSGKHVILVIRSQHPGKGVISEGYVFIDSHFFKENSRQRFCHVIFGGLGPGKTLPGAAHAEPRVQAGQMRKFRVLNVSASSLLLSLDP